MGVEILLLYIALMLFVGPGIVIYGIIIAARQRVRLARDRLLHGGSAVVAGIATAIAGFAFTSFLWHMSRFFPH